MEFTDILNWVWQAITDESIEAAVRPRMIFFSFLALLVTFIAKRTKSKDDDAFLNALRERFFPSSK